MNIHEYQAKELFRTYGVPVPNGQVIFNVEDAERAAWKIAGEKAVVKAQIHAGGRGKAGGVKVATSIDEVNKYTNEIFGKILVTPQTGPEGKEVKAILIEEGCNIQKEYYLSLVLDREMDGITLVASEEGGMDIEEVAEKSPHMIYKESINALVGLSEFQARRICFNINIPVESINEVSKLIMNLYKFFIEKDAMTVEINPLVITEEGKVIALDAKVNFDENSLYRNENIVQYRDLNEEDEKEIEASKYGLSYVALGGNIGCVVNGAGLAMATMDIIKHYGGEPANFLDVGGSANEENVTKAFKIILSDGKVEGILVNIFGGIMKCDIVANGIVDAAKELQLNIPLVIRLEGTNSELGMEIINNSKLDIHSVSNMGEGAKKILELIK